MWVSRLSIPLDARAENVAFDGHFARHATVKVLSGLFAYWRDSCDGLAALSDDDALAVEFVEDLETSGLKFTGRDRLRFPLHGRPIISDGQTHDQSLSVR